MLPRIQKWTSRILRRLSPNPLSRRDFCSRRSTLACAAGRLEHYMFLRAAFKCWRKPEAARACRHHRLTNAVCRLPAVKEHATLRIHTTSIRNALYLRWLRAQAGRRPGPQTIIIPNIASQTTVSQNSTHYRADKMRLCLYILTTFQRVHIPSVWILMLRKTRVNILNFISRCEKKFLTWGN